MNRAHFYIVCAIALGVIVTVWARPHTLGVRLFMTAFMIAVVIADYYATKPK